MKFIGGMWGSQCPGPAIPNEDSAFPHKVLSRFVAAEDKTPPRTLKGFSCTIFKLASRAREIHAIVLVKFMP